MSSIWLQPTGRQEQELRTLIEQLAGEHDTVSFAPHLTVCGVPDHSAAFDAAAAYVRECRLLPLTLVKTAVTGAVITPFRAVFIEVENSPELRQFREQLREIVGGPELIPPHISLLYTLDRMTERHRTEFDATTLATIAARCAAAIKDSHFLLTRPVVNSAGGRMNVSAWRIIRAL
jgi:hypothetical protein